MHLLAAQPGMVTDGSEAVDLGQEPGDVVILSAAESELACLAGAQARLCDAFGADVPSLRLASLLQLGHNMSVDLYVDDVLNDAKFIIVRILGGRGYWDYGIEQLVALARSKDIPLVLLPGDDQPDAALLSLSTVKGSEYQKIWRYLIEGGPQNSENLLRLIYEKLNKLAGMTTPDFRDDGHMIGPVLKLRLGNYMNDEVGMISSLDFAIDDEFTWDINREEPMYIRVSIGYDIIGVNTARKGINYFGKIVNARA